MGLDIKDLKRLIRLCPKINLSNKDLIEIIESESYNNCIAKYTKKNPRNPVEEPIVTHNTDSEIVDASDEEADAIDEVEAEAEHVAECEDESCDCKAE